MAALTRDSSILIVGAGTWGCSIALELARRDYRRVTVLDGNTFPSAIAAGNDLNKIMEEGEWAWIYQSLSDQSVLLLVSLLIYIFSTFQPVLCV